MSQIVEGLYLGSIQVVNDKKFLLKTKITHILTVGSQLEKKFERNLYEDPQTKELIEKRFQIHIDDKQKVQILDYLPQAFQFLNDSFNCPELQLQKKQPKILVHCMGGKSRSASFMIAYLMYKERISFDEAFLKVKQVHSDTNPNQGFANQLQFLEIILKDFFKNVKCSENSNQKQPKNLQEKQPIQNQDQNNGYYNQTNSQSIYQNHSKFYIKEVNLKLDDDIFQLNELIQSYIYQLKEISSQKNLFDKYNPHFMFQRNIVLQCFSDLENLQEQTIKQQIQIKNASSQQKDEQREEVKSQKLPEIQQKDCQWSQLQRQNKQQNSQKNKKIQNQQQIAQMYVQNEIDEQEQEENEEVAEITWY